MASAQLSAKGMSVFSNTILKRLSNRGQSDVDLVCGGQIFNSYKCFLSLSSPRFEAIFNSNKGIKTVNVPDVHPDILELLLQYVYSAKLDELDMTTAPALYEAGAVYEISPLKRLCGSFIARNIDEENVCEVLVLATKFNRLEDRSLMNAARSFVANNREFLESSAWKVFAKRHKLIAKKLQDSLR